MRRILLGGTFDPPHVAHLVAGDVAYRQLGADKVTFIPAGAPWQKADQGVSAGTHRLEMTRLATATVDYFEADDREVLRDGWTYTVDTLESFESSDELVLVMGADAAAALPGWHRYGDILERATVAVLPRPGTAIGQVEEAIGPVVWLDMPLLDISGTEIRSRVLAGRAFRFLVTDQVWAYIGEHGLYRP
jgi:nicotinate-nucleotide adenylyltransferase